MSSRILILQGLPRLTVLLEVEVNRAVCSGLPALSLGSNKTLQLAISRGVEFFTVHKSARVNTHKVISAENVLLSQ